MGKIHRAPDSSNATSETLSAERPPIPGPEPDVVQLVTVLDEHRVNYVLVGRMAAILHGADTFTRDCDIVIDQDAYNLVALNNALEQLNYRVRGAPGSADEANAQAPRAREEPALHPAELQYEFLNAQTDAGPLDVLPTMLMSDERRADYETLDREAVHLTIRGTNITIKVASIEHLIESKTAVGRPHDLSTVDQLRRIQLDGNSTGAN